MGYLRGIQYTVEGKISKRIFQPTRDYLAHAAKWKKETHSYWLDKVALATGV
jgi:hypothetical protein